MSLDAHSDPPLEAIAALVRAAIIADLGDLMITEVHADPRDLDLSQGFTPPALAVWRHSQQDIQETDITRIERINVRFRYVLPQTGPAERKARWPSLSAVWRVISLAVMNGGHPSVDEGADVLEDNAATNAVLNSARVIEYGTSSHSSQNNPEFLGEIQVEYEPHRVDASSLADFLRFYAGYWTPGTPSSEKDDEPDNTSRLAETRVEFPAP